MTQFPSHLRHDKRHIGLHVKELQYTESIVGENENNQRRGSKLTGKIRRSENAVEGEGQTPATVAHPAAVASREKKQPPERDLRSP